ncbi:MAG: elongation factor Ts [Candidatus Berkelbacteria bacterium]|nr:elongation factor Ts [Candidatus Berkelbacteria bacterium]
MTKAKDIAALRNETGAGVMDCKEALIKANGNKEKALEILKTMGKDKAKKRQDQMTKQGLIEAYVHKGSRIGAIVEVACETDFVARTLDFKKLAHNIAMQVASMDAKDVKELLSQPFIFDEKKTIGDLIEEVTAKTGEKCEIKRFERFEVGE